MWPFFQTSSLLDFARFNLDLKQPAIPFSPPPVPFDNDIMASKTAQAPSETRRYSVIDGASTALKQLIAACQTQIPLNLGGFASQVKFSGEDLVHFPTPLKEQDTAMAIKALEGIMAAAIAELAGIQCGKIEVDTEKTSCFLMSAYLTTINGLHKGDEGVKDLIPSQYPHPIQSLSLLVVANFLSDTDIYDGQSVQYRRLAAGLYQTSCGGYYHIHGSLNPDTTLKMIGLEARKPELRRYEESLDVIRAAVKKFPADRLETLNLEHKQAGSHALTWKQFCGTPHGKALLGLGPLTVTSFGSATPAVPFEIKGPSPSGGPQYALRGIKVIEMCRIIAGPTIGRSLAAHGASVIKVTSPNLPDVPFFQVDVNTGKHTIQLDLKGNPDDRATFLRLLEEADVLIDGYRPGALKRLGYGKDRLDEIAQERQRGFVYVAEDCFGGTGVPAAEWSDRAGWQQIADCITGVAYAQGAFMGHADEPVIPPFPMSDYGTGALGALAAMMGLYRRATEGGSYECRTSLCQYDIFLTQLEPLPEHEQARLRRDHAGDFFTLKHYDSVDMVGKRARESMVTVSPGLFRDELMCTARSEGFGNAELRWPKEAVQVAGLTIRHERPARPNKSNDPVGWGTWEVEIDDGRVGGEQS